MRRPICTQSRDRLARLFLEVEACVQRRPDYNIETVNATEAAASSKRDCTMAGPQVKEPGSREATIVDPDPEIRKYLDARSKPLTAEEQAEEQRLIGKCVARSKADAKIVAYADDYEVLEKILKENGIDPKSVVRSFIQDPSVVFVD